MQHAHGLNRQRSPPRTTGATARRQRLVYSIPPQKRTFCFRPIAAPDKTAAVIGGPSCILPGPQRGDYSSCPSSFGAGVILKARTNRPLSFWKVLPSTITEAPMVNLLEANSATLPKHTTSQWLEEPSYSGYSAQKLVTGPFLLSFT